MLFNMSIANVPFVKIPSFEQSAFIAGFVGLVLAVLAVVACFFSTGAETILPQVLVAIASMIPVIAALYMQVFSYYRERWESREDKAYTMFVQLIDNYRSVCFLVSSSSIEVADKERFIYACKALSVFLNNHRNYARFKTYKYVVRSQFSAHDIALLREYVDLHSEDDLSYLLQVINNS